MEWLANIPFVGGPVLTILAFIVVMGIVVSIHEYGHYIVGRWCGIHSEVFSLGFGPVIYSRTDKRGTRWQVAAVPLGGYVKFLGDRDAASTAASDDLAEMDSYDYRRSFPAASVWRRSLTVLAGPVANFILSFVVFAGLILWQGVATERPTIGEITPTPYENPMQVGDIILTFNGQSVENYGDLITFSREVEGTGKVDLGVQRGEDTLTITVPYFHLPLVADVAPLGAASKAGLKSGDIILAADGVELASFADLRDAVEASEDKEVQLTIWRNGETLELGLTPERRDFPDGQGGFVQRVMIGVYGAFYFEPATATPSLLTAMEFGANRVYGVITSSLSGMKHMILGNISVKNLQGPIGIAQISGATAQVSAIRFITLIAVISTAIGLLNLFPIPILDGGRLVIYIYEALRGKPPNPRFMQTVMMVGFALILSIMLLASYNDIMRL
ncbi:MAG: RIP metalloprotease RseP [Rhodobacteraceae bacterium]|nr:RIP metalloprotease RseP [Paracoccaceae bacterium]